MSEKKALNLRDHYTVWREIPTRWMDNDIYGHVNNVVYYSYFDTAVNCWLIDQGLLDIHNGDTIGLVVETGCAYAKSISYPDIVDAGVSVKRIGNSSVQYQVGLFIKGDPEPAAQGFFTHVYVDRDTRRPQPLPQTWRDALSVLLPA